MLRHRMNLERNDDLVNGTNMTIFNEFYSQSGNVFGKRIDQNFR
jgi:hypothetical protein